MESSLTAIEGIPSTRLALGIDLGTTGVKALLIDLDTGAQGGRGYRAYPSRTSDDGAHEQDPEDWWSATVAAVNDALGGRSPSSVRAIGLSGHMHAVVLVDQWDRCIRPAMTWADRRSAPQVLRLRRSQALFTERCANPVVEAFSAPKVAWLAECEPESLRRATRLVQPKDVLRHRLTGTWGTDATDASGTLLYDVRRHVWDDALWNLCGADEALAPQVAASADVVGELTSPAARQLGLLTGTPVVAGAGDVSCSALGAGVVRSGTVYVNAGTAAQVLAPLDHAVAGTHFVFGRAASTGYLAMASVYAAGMSVDWAGRTLLASDTGAGQPGPRMDLMALEDRPGASGAVFLPHLLGTSVPTHDPLVRGAFVGLTADHRPATLARAVLEGVAYACAAAVDHVASLVGGTTRVRVGGGLSGSRVWCDALAALQEVPVERVARDSSPVGAAMLAGLGLGVWASAEEAADACVDVQVQPRPDDQATRMYQAAQRRYDAAAEAMAELGQRFERQREAVDNLTCDEPSPTGVPV